MSNPKRKKLSWIPVVAGILKHEDKVLLGRRPAKKSLAGLWEFPGGKIEPGETPESALHRELQEELGIDVEVGALKYATTHSYEDVGVVLMFFEVSYWQGQPKPIHHEELIWTSLDEVHKLEVPEANRKVLHRLSEALV